ncbi:MAG: hypothetical protein HY515_01255 [Candidatus Aenigmarchaeota archaeon]|nr:hypothetical protein [Candidatus Aenigmarchaeota archaeon]
MKALFCPRCSSPSIHPYIGGITGTFQCRTCGYLGSLVIEQDFEKKIEGGKDGETLPSKSEPRKRRIRLGFEPKT